jgi:hypothetical protein
MAGDNLQDNLGQVVQLLKDGLGDNLYSCSIYGSAVRGNAIAGVSDINLLIILKESSPAAHNAIATVLDRDEKVDPFVLGHRGLPRSMVCFANKFASIRRNYRVLYGADPFLGLPADTSQQRFVCEQALRNMRLRMVHAFVTRHRHRRYDRYLAHCITPLFCQLSDILRLSSVDLPRSFEDRIPVIEREFQINSLVLRDLLKFKESPRKLSDGDAARWHEQLFLILDTAVVWVEAHWQQ